MFSAKLLCTCTTEECQDKQKTECEADYYCYVQNMDSILTRGCINDRTPLLCENRRPAKLKHGEFPSWPVMYCCKGDDYCNRDMVPAKPTEKTRTFLIYLSIFFFI